MGRVALVVELEPEVLEPLAGLPSDGGGPLADAAGEDEQVEPAQRRREGADTLSELIAEHGDGLGGGRLPIPPLQQRLHVRARSRDAQQARLVVHEPLQPVGIIAFPSQQVDRDAGVQVSAAGSHHEAARRRQAHRRVHGHPVPHRGHAGAITQMRDDGSSTGGRPEPPHDVFVGEAVEAVALDPGIPERAGQRQSPGQLGHSMVERRIEAGNLRQRGEPRGHCLHDRQLAGEMQRGQGDEPAESLEEARIHAFRRRVLGSAVDQAMPDGVQRGKPAALQRVEDRMHRSGVVRIVARRLRRGRIAIVQPEAPLLEANPLHRARHQPALVAPCRGGLVFVDRELQRGGAGVETEDPARLRRHVSVHFHSRTSGMSSRCSRIHVWWRASMASQCSTSAAARPAIGEARRTASRAR